MQVDPIQEFRAAIEKVDALSSELLSLDRAQTARDAVADRVAASASEAEALKHGKELSDAENLLSVRKIRADKQRADRDAVLTEAAALLPRACQAARDLIAEASASCLGDARAAAKALFSPHDAELHPQAERLIDMATNAHAARAFDHDNTLRHSLRFHVPPFESEPAEYVHLARLGLDAINDAVSALPSIRKDSERLSAATRKFVAALA